MKLINFKKVGIVLGIIIVLNLFMNFGIATFYDSPEYDKFCSAESRARLNDTKELCETNQGLWYEDNGGMTRDVKLPTPAILNGEKVSFGWCDVDYKCRQNFEDANDLYKRNVFITLVALGFVLLVTGFFITSQSILSVSFTYGGLLSVIIGTIRFWSEMDDYLRFIILGIALAVLILIAIKKFKGE